MYSKLRTNWVTGANMVLFCIKTELCLTYNLGMLQMTFGTP